MKSLYIHIPFCKQKCLYCDFNSYSNADKLINDYVIALKNEIQSYSFNAYKTIYFGGGTPSYIDEKHIIDILNCLDYKKAEEITIEVNPGTVTKEKLSSYIENGINRLSIGLQATQDSILKEIGRIHTLEDFEKTYIMAREVGFENISVDLMFGLPDQTLKDVEESLDFIIKINPEHVSCYSLILHENIFNNLPEDEEEREMYYLIINKLKEAGYEHYEISNFAKPGYESKHNLVYWNQGEYVGAGAGASSYIDNKRYTNVANINKYIANYEDRTIEEVQNEDDKEREYIILKLRLIDGINIEEMNEKFNINVCEKYKEQIEKMEKLELLEIINGKIRLTSKGLDLANIVWEEFL